MVRPRQYFKWRNEPTNLLLEDPPGDFSVKESLSPSAGLGLFSNRAFETRQFPIVYRGDRTILTMSTHLIEDHLISF